MAYLQLDMRPLVHSWGPKTQASTRKAIEIATAHGSFDTANGSKRHKPTRSSKWAAQDKAMHEEALAGGHHAECLPVENLNGTGSPNTLKQVKRKAPCSPSASGEPSPPEKRQKSSPVQDQQHERIRLMEHNSVEQRYHTWLGSKMP